jgi:hypothetical protein
MHAVIKILILEIACTFIDYCIQDKTICELINGPGYSYAVNMYIKINIIYISNNQCQL